jgi:hypothetical protein
VLNNRLNTFSDEFLLLNENQTGFRKKYSTLDNTFVIYGLFEKGTILPASQVFGILPELKIRLNRSTYNVKNISEVDFMNPFLILSSPRTTKYFY